MSALMLYLYKVYDSEFRYTFVILYGIFIPVFTVTGVSCEETITLVTVEWMLRDWVSFSFFVASAY